MKNDLLIHALIAEDEPIILNNIAKKVEQASPCISVTGKAECGKSALELLEKQSFDLLITDIEMPGMNGLELIKLVKERYPDLKIIILSGYSNFEYARTALRYGVEDYLLKPVSLDHLAELLDKLCPQIFIEKHQQKKEILSMSLNGNAPDSISPHIFRDGSFFLIHLTIGNLASNYGTKMPSKEYLSLWEHIDFNKCFQSTPELLYLWIIDETCPLQKFIIIYSIEEKRTAQYLNVLLFNYLEQNLDGYPYMIMAFPKPISYTEIWNTAKTLRAASANHAIPFTQKAFLSSPDLRSPFLSPDIQNENIHFLCNIGNGSQFINYVKSIVSEYVTQGYPVETIMNFIYEAYIGMSYNFQVDMNSCQSTAFLLLSNFYSYKTPADLIQLLILSMNELLSHTIETTLNTLCLKLRQYIEVNYRLKISLNDLSAHFGYTPSYVNRIFKKEYGISPLQYITNLKIGHAKDLLKKDRDLDIKAIAAAIGYEDARYFSRVFKNETGLTPSAWMKENLL